MPRKKKTGVELDPAEKARQKKLRAAQRREDRKARKGSPSDPASKRSAPPDYSGSFIRDDFLWLRRIDAKNYAHKIIQGHKERPYWVSIAHSRTDGNPPPSNFFPCNTYRTDSRVYYAFLFREHRDLFFATRDDARKELTEAMTRLFSNS